MDSKMNVIRCRKDTTAIVELVIVWRRGRHFCWGALRSESGRWRENGGIGNGAYGTDE